MQMPAQIQQCPNTEAISPVQVFQHEDQRPVCAQSAQESGHGAEHLQPRPLPLQFRRGYWLARGQERQVWPGRAFGTRGKPVRQCLAEWEERNGSVLLEAVADERLETLLSTMRQRLTHQARLANAGLTGEEHEAARAP